MCFRFQLWKNLGMVDRHNILFCQNILYRYCIFFYMHFLPFPANLTTFCSQFTILCLGSGNLKHTYIFLALSAQRRLIRLGRMPRMIWVFAGRTLILLVLSCRGLFGINFGFFFQIWKKVRGRRGSGPNSSASEPKKATLPLISVWRYNGTPSSKRISIRFL